MRIVVLEEFTFLIDCTVKKSFLQNSSFSCQSKNSNDSIFRIVWLISLTFYYFMGILAFSLDSHDKNTSIFLKITINSFSGFYLSKQSNNLFVKNKIDSLINLSNKSFEG